MEYHKQLYNKRRWLTISISLLAALTGGVFATHSHVNVHADNVNRANQTTYQQNQSNTYQPRLHANYPSVVSHNQQANSNGQHIVPQLHNLCGQILKNNVQSGLSSDGVTSSQNNESSINNDFKASVTTNFEYRNIKNGNILLSDLIDAPAGTQINYDQYTQPNRGNLPDGYTFVKLGRHNNVFESNSTSAGNNIIWVSPINNNKQSGSSSANSSRASNSSGSSSASSSASAPNSNSNVVPSSGPNSVTPSSSHSSSSSASNGIIPSSNHSNNHSDSSSASNSMAPSHGPHSNASSSASAPNSNSNVIPSSGPNSVTPSSSHSSSSSASNGIIPSSNHSDGSSTSNNVTPSYEPSNSASSIDFNDNLNNWYTSFMNSITAHHQASIAPSSSNSSNSQPASTSSSTAVNIKHNIHKNHRISHRSKAWKARHNNLNHRLKAWRYHNHLYRTYQQYLTPKDFRRGHRMYVRLIKNCNEYRSTHYIRRNRVRHLRRGMRLAVKRVVLITKRITRLQLINGDYVTSNKHFVRALKK